MERDASPTFWNPAEIPSRELAPGVAARIAWGRNLMFSLVTLSPGAVVPEHAHPHEQMGMVVSGTMELSAAGTTRLLAANDLYLVPGGTPHGAKAGPRGATVLDAFAPPREEYKPGGGPAPPSE